MHSKDEGSQRQQHIEGKEGFGASVDIPDSVAG